MRSFLLGSLILLMACSSKRKVPKGILSPSDMQSVIWDLARADQWLNNFVFPNDSSLNKSKESIRIYEQIYTLHHTSKETFQKSYTFYKAHPITFRVMLDSITEKANMPVTDLPEAGKTVDTARLRRLPQRYLAESLYSKKPPRIRP